MLRLHVLAPAARLRCFGAPYLHVKILTSTLQTSSLRVCTPTSCLRRSLPRYLDAFRPSHLRRASGASELRTYTSQYLHLASRSPYLRICTPTACLRRSIPRYLDTFTPSRLRRASGASELRTSTSQYLHPASRPPYLRVCTPSVPPALNTSCFHAAHL